MRRLGWEMECREAGRSNADGRMKTMGLYWSALHYFMKYPIETTY
jgi:hypothetical protein